MLESIRKRRNSVIILLAFAAIIIVFVFWGIGPTGNGGPTQAAVAEVDGEQIPVKDYVNLYNREVEYFKNTFKEQFTDELAKKMNLKQRALDILINRSLAIKEADRQGIKATEEEVQESIKSIPMFSKNGAFDKDTYFQVLNANRIKPADFEKGIENDLVTAKMRDRIVKDIKVTDEDVKKAYLKDNRKINLDFIAVDGASLASKINVTDDEAKEYLKKNGSAFMVPAKVKVAYAYANYNDMAKQAKFTPEEVEAYYNRNSKQFEIPGAIKARHILIRPDANAADKEKAKNEAKKKTEEVLAKVKNGGKFAELAKAYSQDPGSAKQGGELGWFQKGIMIKSFEETAFAMKKGEVSNVIETEFGYHIILVEDKKESGLVPIKQAEPAIKRVLAVQKGQTMAKEALASLESPFKLAKSIDEMKKAASAKNLKFASTDFFTEDDKKVEIVRNEMLRDVVFTLKAGDVSKPIETPEGAFIIKSVEKVDSHVPDYAEIAGKVKDALKAEKAYAEAGKKADELLKRVKGGEDFTNAAKAEKLKVEQTGFFSKAEGFMPKTGIFLGDKEGLLDLTTTAPYPEALSNNKKYYIFKLNSVKEVDELGLEAKKEEIKGRLLAEKQDEALNVWLKGLREKSKIKIFDNNL
ncbi:MAG: SurA N-terminal domain-containing protein [Deltaproteobacteria bacterium]|nr:SurA N-terminal domain-containing protein [Deltaproteobacteria bacterium]